MRTTNLLILLISFVLCTVPAFATVKPSIESMVKFSDTIVTGKIIAFDKSESTFQIVTIDIIEVLKGKHTVKVPIRVKYKSDPNDYGEFGFKFQEILESKEESIFFLLTAKGVFKLVDNWFGIEPLEPQIEEKVKLIVAKTT